MNEPKLGPLALYLSFLSRWEIISVVLIDGTLFLGLLLQLIALRLKGLEAPKYL